MDILDVSTIGTGGMMPFHYRHLAALAARLNGRILLIDCGEGTQVTLRRLGWGFKNVDVICITHVHGDHISGLPGLLLAIGNSGREEPLHIVGPAGVARVVNGLRVVAPDLPYEVLIQELPARFDGVLSVRRGVFDLGVIALDHGMPCVGYSLHVPRAGLFDPGKARAHDVPLRLWGVLQRGETAERDGRVYTPDMVLGPPRRGIKLCYITDTRPIATIPAFIQGADLFICEGTYGGDDMLDKAEERKHMLFSEAAALARDGGVRELWLTHFSPAMPDPEPFLPNAARVFPNARVCHDRMCATLAFDEQ